MPNTRKQITAKEAWARVSVSNRRLREALEAIAAFAGNQNLQREAGPGARFLRRIHELVTVALEADQQGRRAA